MRQSARPFMEQQPEPALVFGGGGQASNKIGIQIGDEARQCCNADPRAYGRKDPCGRSVLNGDRAMAVAAVLELRQRGWKLEDAIARVTSSPSEARKIASAIAILPTLKV